MLLHYSYLAVATLINHYSMSLSLLYTVVSLADDEREKGKPPACWLVVSVAEKPLIAIDCHRGENSLFKCMMPLGKRGMAFVYGVEAGGFKVDNVH